MMKLLLLPLLLLAALIPARSAELELYCTTDLHGRAATRSSGSMSATPRRERCFRNSPAAGS